MVVGPALVMSSVPSSASAASGSTSTSFAFALLFFFFLAIQGVPPEVAQLLLLCSSAPLTPFDDICLRAGLVDEECAVTFEVELELATLYRHVFATSKLRSWLHSLVGPACGTCRQPPPFARLRYRCASADWPALCYSALPATTQLFTAESPSSVSEMALNFQLTATSCRLILGAVARRTCH